MTQQIITVDTAPQKDAKTYRYKAEKLAKQLGADAADIAQAERYAAQLDSHNAWGLPYLGYSAAEGYGYAYAPQLAVDPASGWNAHDAFKTLTYNAQSAFAALLLYTTRDVDRDAVAAFLRYERGCEIHFSDQRY